MQNSINFLLNERKNFKTVIKALICWKQILFKHPTLGFVLNFILTSNNFTDLKLQKNLWSFF